MDNEAAAGGWVGSAFPPLFGIPNWDVSLELHVTKACHLLVTDARPCALCEIFAAAWRQIIIPMSSTIEETCNIHNQVRVNS